MKFMFFNKISLYQTCYCLNMVSVTSASRYITPASRYQSRYQSRSSMYISGLIPRNFAEFAETVPIGTTLEKQLEPISIAYRGRSVGPSVKYVDD